MKKTIYMKNKILIPLNINLWWNFGFILSFLMMTQIISGIMLSMYFFFTNPFINLLSMSMNMNYGWMMRIFHSNTCSMIFIIIYIHLSRNMFFYSAKNYLTWLSGSIMLLLLMLTAFLGYCLPWSQMSYWGMMVITNFISIIPLIGNKILLWMWSNHTINLSTLSHIMTVHFILPLLITLLMMMHLIFLHLNLSNNPLGINNKIDLIPFFPLFMLKDIMILKLILLLMWNILTFNPYMLNNNDNFIEINELSTPQHIEPEWYFLFFYSILRSIENKISGMMTILILIFIIIIMPMIMKQKFQNLNFYNLNKILLPLIIQLMIMISWMSTKNLESPFLQLNLLLMMMTLITTMLSKIYTMMIDKII